MLKICYNLQPLDNPRSFSKLKMSRINTKTKATLDMEKILDIIEILSYEKGIPSQVTLDIVKNLIIKTAKQEIGEDINYSVETNQKDRTLKLIHNLSVCEDSSERLQSNPHNTISLTEARKIDPSLNVDDLIKSELTLENMSRSAVNRIFQDLEFHLQRTMEDLIFKSFRERVGKIVTGVVLEVDKNENTFVEVDDIRAILPFKNRIKGEKFKIGDAITCILKHVRMDKNGIYIELSRTTPRLLEELLTLEVPEIKDGEVKIYKTARIPGDRSKIAVFTQNPKIDPIGSSVGMKGVRINAVGKQLNNESIDCIQYSEVPEIFITRALAPASIINVQIKNIESSMQNSQQSESETSLDEKNAPKKRNQKLAIVKLMSDQKSKAIGRNGVNIRLASMLTGYDLEIEEIASQMDASNPSQPSKLGIDALQSLFKD